MHRMWPYVLAFGVLIAYSLWISGPYLRSILVRDAAITTWSHFATAPIAGTISFQPIAINGQINSSGVLATVTNNHISREQVDAAELRVSLAEARLEHANDLLAEIISLEDDRRATKANFAEVFRRQLDLKINRLNTEITVNQQRMKAIQSIVARRQELANRGAGSVTDTDEVRLRLANIRLDIERLQSDLEYTIQRREFANQGVFVDAEGEDPSWVLGDRLELKLEKKKARHAARIVGIELENARVQLTKSKLDLKRLGTSDVIVPAGKIFWRSHAVTGMSVAEGDVVAEWIDCSRLFVDMPVSDAEASLISNGEVADVVLEGEQRVRLAEVVLVRGSAAVLGRNELASLAKGRASGEAQVLLRLDAELHDFASCPVGRAAFVDFKGIGLLDVLRARLRI